MKLFLNLILFFLWTLNSSGQEYQLSGRVTYGGEPQDGVVVRIANTAAGTLTNEKGYYSLSLEKGVYEIIYSKGNQKKLRVTLDKDMVLNVDLEGVHEELEEVFLSAVRVGTAAPLTFTNLSEEEIENRNLGQDIPSLMQYMPAVVTTSDAGNGIGYSSIRVRGSDATRINVTINGIPYNDAESHGTFWVNLGDFASSVENLQLQRGVGTSTNGAGAFGASLNIETEDDLKEASAEASASYGSYNTHKETVKFSTGILDEHWIVSGRVSNIASDGYIDRAFSKLKSYLFQATYLKENTEIKALTFGGSETTYQAWDGIDKSTLSQDRTFNPSGAFTDEEGNLAYYENHVDDYKQDHYQLHWRQKLGNKWSSHLGFHYTYGRGYYESYREDSRLEEYGIEDFTVDEIMLTETDLITRKWLVNDFYGSIFNLRYKNDQLELIAGGAWNQYVGEHFGEVIWAKFAPLDKPFQRYYENDALKTDYNIFSKATYLLADGLSGFLDLQLRMVDYEASGSVEENLPFTVNDRFSFFNPKLGLNYRIGTNNNIYVSYARAHREPNRTDYENGDPEPERLDDLELGWRYQQGNFHINSNIYYMAYDNQLVLTGELDNVGSPIRKNSGNSYRLGLEIEAFLRLGEKLNWRPNLALSTNKNLHWFSMWDGELRDFGTTDISYSPEVVAANVLEYFPFSDLEIRLMTKYVGQQYMSNIESQSSVLEDYLVHDLNIQYTWREAPVFKQLTFTALVNNLLGREYVSNGYYYTYEVDGQTVEGAGYYPQATTNFLIGMSLKF